MRTCEHCSAPLRHWARADARFCSTRCRVAHHRAAQTHAPRALPAELINRPRWVNHLNKRPVCSRTGRWASVTDPSTWSTHAAASATGAPLGFVLGDGIGCIDLDGCLDEHGIPNEAARVLLAYYEGSYVEVSPSGRGLHIWGTAVPQRGFKRMWRGQRIEFYSQGRYITVTENVYQDGSLAPL